MKTEDVEKFGPSPKVGPSPNAGPSSTEKEDMNIADKEKREQSFIWGQSSSISEEDAGCRRDGYRLNEGTTIPPHETPALIGSIAPDAEPRTFVGPVDDQKVCSKLSLA